VVTYIFADVEGAAAASIFRVGEYALSGEGGTDVRKGTGTRSEQPIGARRVIEGRVSHTRNSCKGTDIVGQ
jgi:hypothetical protein